MDYRFINYLAGIKLILTFDKMKNMKPILLDPNTNYDYVDMTLYLQDVKILHNACVDILNECPEMVGYRQVAEKLRMVIEAHNELKP
jgi:hypothetical protein